jgi:hypothetical protein
LIAQKRAEIAAKLAAMKKPITAPTSQPGGSNQTHTNRFSGEQAADLQRRIEEATKKVHAAKLRNNPYLVRRIYHR